MTERACGRAEVEPRTPPAPHDADQLQQVLINLLKNAVEASPSGAAVRVRVGLATRNAPLGGVAEAPIPAAITIRIEDRGSGIPPEHLKTVFEPFFTTKQDGSGLGLYISHDIIKRHGGHIAIHCQTQVGTTFVVDLPLEPSGGSK
jgi:signal transduction histidine kinase